MNQSGFDMSIVERITTPFYYYDMDLLQATLDQINHLTAGLPCCVHYALKANSNAIAEIDDDETTPTPAT